MTTPLPCNDLGEAAWALLPPNELLQSISPAERGRLMRFLTVVPLEAGTALCESGTRLQHVWFPHDAVASTVVELAEGTAVDVGLLGCESLVGTDPLYGGRRSAMTVVVQIAGHASRMDADDFQREVVVRGGEPYGVFLGFAAAYQRTMAQIGACNARHTLLQRFTRLLLMLDDRRGRRAIDITQDRLAVMLAARRASITEAANALRSSGGLEYRRGHIAIRDRGRLLAESCACYPAIARLVSRAELAARNERLTGAAEGR